MNEIEKALRDRFLLQEEYLGNNKLVNKIIPLVSVTVATYQHANYIKECLDGILMQKTDFLYEIILGEDGSTDGTKQICKEYAERYPDKIRLFIRDRRLSQYKESNGKIIRFNGIWNRMSSRGKYIAWCEGDDYWIDPYKLQKQVDFLEKHPECVYSCHRYYIYNEYTKEKYLMPNKYFDNQPDVSEFIFEKDYPFLQEWITKTLTCVYRRDAYDTTIANKYKYYRDVHLVYYLLSKGKGVCHSFVGGVYRKNSGGVFGSQTPINQLKISYAVYTEMYSVTKDHIFKKILRSIYLQIVAKEKKIQIPIKWFELETLLLYLPYKILKKMFVS